MADLAHVMLIEQMAEIFTEQTTDQINKLKRNRCAKCKWRGTLSGDGRSNVGAIYCNWADMNDKNFRDCLPSECKYYEPGKKKRNPPKSVRVGKVRRRG